MIATLVLALLVAPPAPRVRPDGALTPGVVRALSTRAVCRTAWGRDRRHVTVAMKQRVAEAYGVPWREHARYEFDHLIPRSLAGADDEANLWPQAWAGAWGARQKDRLEVVLGQEVCAGRMTLAFAQDVIRADWIAAYRLYVREKETR